ncbi:MAG: hypothetical protein H6R18_289 [Proteobacteria bacterium]|nr:hypothetical protein [Pseudomonadota bacterium]
MSDMHRAACARPENLAVQPNQPLFPLGQIVATPAVLEHFRRHGIDPFEYLRRHRCGDWGGELCAEDIAANRSAVQNGSRVFSAYRIAGEKVWIITEADRSATTLLFPEEY